jgi:PPOX class probable F420-dependent enzyme
MRKWAEELLTNSRIGHFATASKNGRPHVVPICYVFDGATIYSSIDEKPKRADPGHLRRTVNILENPQISLIVDTYNEDWGKLKYVLVTGRAEIIRGGEEHEKALALLRNKYQQYLSMKLEGRPVLKITPTRIVEWNGA